MGCSPHLSAEDIRRYTALEMRVHESIAAYAHMQNCDVCRAKAEEAARKFEDAAWSPFKADEPNA